MATNLDKFTEVAEEVGGELRDYSGRFMFGEVAKGMEVTRDQFDEACTRLDELGIQYKRDNMGLDYIIYFHSKGYMMEDYVDPMEDGSLKEEDDELDEE